MKDLLTYWLNLLIQFVIPTQNPENLPKPTPPPLPPKYQWDTKDHVRHTVRVICDEEGLTLEQKDTLCATIACESQFNTKAIHPNILNGKTVSTDYGLCQWNDFYHRKEISPAEALDNPEKAVRLMCKYWLRGQRHLWVCYLKGGYKAYL